MNFKFNQTNIEDCIIIQNKSEWAENRTQEYIDYKECKIILGLFNWPDNLSKIKTIDNYKASEKHNIIIDIEDDESSLFEIKVVVQKYSDEYYVVLYSESVRESDTIKRDKNGYRNNLYEDSWVKNRVIYVCDQFNGLKSFFRFVNYRVDYVFNYFHSNPDSGFLNFLK